MSGRFSVLVASFVVAAVLVPHGAAHAQENGPRQVLIQSRFIEVSLGAGLSRASGELGIDFNGFVFGHETRSFSNTRGFVTLGAQTQVAQFDAANLIVGARTQIYTDSEVFNLNVPVPQTNNAYLNIVGENGFNFAPFLGVEFPLGQIISALESQATVRVMAGPTISRQKLTVQFDDNGNLSEYSQSKFVVAPTIGVSVASTNVIVPDGQTVAVGGFNVGVEANVQATFMRKLPFIADIPIIGATFRQHRDTEVSGQLIIFITPRIVRSDQ